MDLINTSTFEVSAFRNEIIKDPKSKNIERFLDDYQKGQSSRIKGLPFSDCADKSLSLEKNIQVFAKSDAGAQVIVTASKEVYYLENNRRIRLLISADFSASFNGQINDFYKDAFNNIWICTQQGVFKISVRKNNFEIYHSAAQQFGKTATQSRGIYVSLIEGKRTVYSNAIAVLFA